jgi:four helix bundle protein
MGVTMARIASYRELTVWQMAMELAVGCYRAIEKFPSREQFGLAAHLRKTAVTIASNIAEGHNRASRAAYRNHVAVAVGSQAEFETQVELSHRLSLMDAGDAAGLMEGAANVGRLLHRLLAALDARSGDASSAPSA